MGGGRGVEIKVAEFGFLDIGNSFYVERSGFFGVKNYVFIR